MRATLTMCQKVLTISESVVKACMDMKACLSVNRQAFIDLAQNKAVVPTRIGIPYHDHHDHHHHHDHDDHDHHHHHGDAPSSGGGGGGGAADFSLFKPAAVPDRDLMAIKLVSIRQHNPAHGLPLVPATVVSMDPSTGLVNGLVAGTYLTGARTAAGSAISVSLYRPTMKRLVMFGAGLQARLHIEAISTILERPIPHVTLVNRTVSRAKELAKEIQENNPQWVEQFDVTPLHGGDPWVLAEALSHADVVVTATNTATPLFTDSTPLKPGCHLCSVGSYTPQMQEIAARIVDQCTVIIDTPDAKTVGDLQHLTEHHPMHLLGNVLADTEASGTPPPRHEGMPFTFFKSVGTAIQDAYTTQMIMEKAREKGLGTEVEL